MTDSAPSHRRARILLGVIVLGAGSIILLAAPFLWKWATLKTVETFYRDGSLSMRYVVKRWKSAQWMEIPTVEPPKRKRGLFGGNDSVSIQPVGQPHGTITCFFPNSRKKLQGEYKDGRLTGVWTSWDEQGKVNVQHRYERGESA